MRYATGSQQRAQLPWGNDDAEWLQHIPGAEPLLRVQHQQLSDQAHCVLRHATVPERVGGVEGGGWWRGDRKRQVLFAEHDLKSHAYKNHSWKTFSTNRGWSALISSISPFNSPTIVTCAGGGGGGGRRGGPRTHSGMEYSAALILRKSSWGMLS